MKRVVVYVYCYLGVCAMAFSATTARAVWEVEDTGTDATATDSNGGCFDSTQIGATGVDMTYGANKGKVTFTGRLSSPGSSAGVTDSDTTGSFTNMMLGNCINIAGQGVYTITGFTDSKHVTVNATLASFSGATGVVGGALATVGGLCANVQPGNTAYFKGTFDTGSGTPAACNTTAGTGALPIRLRGYGTTRGDNGYFTIATTGASAKTAFSLNKSYYSLENAIVDSKHSANSSALQVYTGTGITLRNLRLINYKYTSTTGTGVGLYLNTAASVAIRNIYISTSDACSYGLNTGSSYFVMAGSVVTGNACPGVYVNSTSTASLWGNVFAGQSGASGYGVQYAGNARPLMLINNTFAGNVEGVHFDSEVGAANTLAGNNLFVGNSSAAVNNAGTGILNLFPFNYSAFYNNGNSNGYIGIPAGADDRTAESSDPLPDAGSANYALANGSSLCTAGFPGAFNNLGTTGYMPIGAVACQSGSSAGTAFFGFIQ